MAAQSINHMVSWSDTCHPLAILDYAIQATSDAIASKAKDDTLRLGMGTTCACAWVIGSRLFIGKSRPKKKSYFWVWAMLGLVVLFLMALAIVIATRDA